MNTPRRATLLRIEDISDFAIDTIRGMTSGRYDPWSIARGYGMRISPRVAAFYLVLQVADKVLETHGMEHVRYKDEHGLFRFSYLNTGDSYANTLVWDHGRRRFMVCSYSDLVL